MPRVKSPLLRRANVCLITKEKRMKLFAARVIIVERDIFEEQAQLRE
jgi:hypothetical protein